MQEHNMPRDNPPPKPAKTIKRVVKDVSGDLPTPVKAQSQPATKKKPSAPRLTAAQIRQNAEDEKYRAKTKAYTKYCRHSIFHHASLCDEVSRMYNRIETVNEECSMLAKKLQKYERNKIRRLQTFYRRKEAAAKRGSPQISVTDEFSNPSFSAQ
uniref:BZIP domain-containing protein n=1 Tax=Rhabditophanes sp. KR3021 TaxID=114890 RepID=A0AC35U144_9BILA